MFKKSFSILILSESLSFRASILSIYFYNRKILIFSSPASYLRNHRTYLRYYFSAMKRTRYQHRERSRSNLVRPLHAD